MSCTSLYALYKTKVNCIKELRNGHGSGTAIWDYISLKLYGHKFNIFATDNRIFWLSYKHSRLDNDEKVVFLSTYDDAFIEIKNLAQFSDACHKVSALIIQTTNWEWNHFEEIGNVAAELYKNHDSRCQGMAISCTSTCNLWEQNINDIDAWGVYKEVT